ncbi:putative transcription regulator Others family [Medicago truncatula]|uniref:Paired amphipathic helix protein n=1 Tax=Medicago truncatula TaxID=3880 RepID=G7K6X6_MEDTR|nr:paired amphipathic helix protein [Medicago truncatula]RHN55197.1 putative transcription regulator Others family [Medicago truncatula]
MKPHKMKRIYADRPVVDYRYISNYVREVKNRFQHADHRHVYLSFLEMLSKYIEREKTVGNVISEVAVLFEGHDDLIEGFTNFIPLRR